MKTSVSLFLSDILPYKRKLYHKIVKNDIFGTQTPDENFPLLKKAGLDGIEVCLPQYIETTDEDVTEIKALTKKHKLPVLSVHQALRFFTATKVPEIERLVQIASDLEAPIVVLHMSTARKQIFNQVYLDRLHVLEKQYDVVITFENMEKYIGSLSSKYRWEGITFSELIKKTDFNITFDIVHLAHSGGDILEFYKNNKERIANIHISDYRYNAFNSSLRPLRYKHMPLGAGDLPITEFLQLLKQEHYQGLLTMEIHTDLAGICESASIIQASR